jgi:predicted RNase H-like nuclease (RuvC/YqgF family)
VKPNHSTGFIIEGLTSNTKSTAVTESTTKFDQTTANHIECSLANKKLCDELNNKYIAQSRKVNWLKKGYILAQNEYNDCNNKKNRCEGIETTIKNTQAQINDFDKNIKTKSSELDTCNADKNVCNNLNKQITDKKKEIERLKKNILRKEARYIKEKCNE